MFVDQVAYMGSSMVYLYLLLVSFMVLHGDVGVAKENVNSTAFDVLEAVAKEVNIEYMEFLPVPDIARYYLWGSYNTSSRSSKSTSLKEITQIFARVAYVERTIDMVATMLFGPEKGRSILRVVKERRPYFMDEPQCVKSSVRLFIKHCGWVAEHGMQYRKYFENMCDHVIEKTAIEEAFIAVCGMDNVGPSVIDVENPTFDVVPAPMLGSSDFCNRVSVHGISRTKLQSYAKAYRLLVDPSITIPSEWHHKIQICFHRDASLGLCQCEEDDWIPIQRRLWGTFMSPYDQNFVDVKFTDGVSGSVSVTLNEVSHNSRYELLVAGIGFLIIAPFAGREILSKDVDDGVTKFIKWVMRALAVSSFLLSSIDAPLAMVALASCLALSSVISPFIATMLEQSSGQRKNTHNVSRPLEGPADASRMTHDISNRNKLSKKSTTKSVAELESSPEIESVVH